jgi:outer membrane receptor protein involved in Fe transport
VRWYAGLRQNWVGRGETFFAPNGGFAVPVGRLRVRGSVYRSFRAPTLNELYREFRVGNTATLANPGLTSEHLFGAETGVDWVGENGRLSVTAFRNDIAGLITNVTLSSTPTAIVRQRQNAASALSRGVEASASRRWRAFVADASYLYADSRYSSGLRVPQIPKNQGNARLTWQGARTTISGGLISYSLQFEDDLNQFPLPGFATLQLYGRQALGHGVSAVAAVENLLDRSYLTGFTPTPMIGAPRLWRLGFRWEVR